MQSHEVHMPHCCNSVLEYHEEGEGLTLQDSSTDQLYAQILQFYDEIFNSVRTWIELTLTD